MADLPILKGLIQTTAAMTHDIPSVNMKELLEFSVFASLGGCKLEKMETPDTLESHF